ncbi:MAG: hypothetical protein R2748_03075 [Bryobacterales bacterium]
MTTEPAPQAMVAAGPNNYRRWWNLSWHAVEEGGQTKAGDWTPEDDARLRALVDYGHSQGVFVRFYCLNGYPADDPHGWSPRLQLRLAGSGATALARRQSGGRGLAGDRSV